MTHDEYDNDPETIALADAIFAHLNALAENNEIGTMADGSRYRVIKTIEADGSIRYHEIPAILN